MEASQISLIFGSGIIVVAGALWALKYLLDHNRDLTKSIDDERRKVLDRTIDELQEITKSLKAEIAQLSIKVHDLERTLNQLASTIKEKELSNSSQAEELRQFTRQLLQQFKGESEKIPIGKEKIWVRTKDPKKSGGG